MENRDKNQLEEEAEGQLSIDVYQDDHSVYIVAPIAGVAASSIDLTITEEVVTIRGKREFIEAQADNYILQECYWGAFSRSYVMPVAVNSNNAKATIKDGLLKIVIPKDDRVKTKVIKIFDQE